MEKHNLYIDFDGVILDTITPLYNDIEKNNIKKENLNEFFEKYPWENIINDKYIINSSIEKINKIIESNRFNLAVLTHVNSINEAVLKIKYLRKYFDDITIIPCPKEISKTKMIHTKDAILVDDYTGNLREWENKGGIPVRFSAKRNGKGFNVISSLDELLQMFD